jgi:hypothetical protein
MKATMTKTDVSKVNFIKSLNKEEYSLYHTYNRMIDVQEAIRIIYMLSLKDEPVPIKVKEIDFILFKTKKAGIVADLVCLENKGNFELYGMSVKAYNEYERYMSELLTSK